MPLPLSRPLSFTLVGLAYVAALGAAGGTIALLPGQDPLVQIAAADIVATIVAFGFAWAFDNTSVYDPYWSVAPIAIALTLVYLATPAASELRQAVVVSLVIAWGLRLTWNWARGWSGLGHEDWRYADYRRRTGKAYWLVSLTGLHMMPTLWVLGGCLALGPALVDGDRPFGLLDLFALAFTLAAITVETVADIQLHRFLRDRTDPGQICDRGLWAWSRHPNYLGELSFWWGLWLFGVAASPDDWAWTLVGPVAMTGLFVFVSIPLLDKRSLARRPDYAAHMARVPAMVPRPWRRPAKG